MRKVLITGANSFIGAYFKNNVADITVDEVDLLTTEPHDIYFGGYDVVFHVAAIVHQDKGTPDDIYYAVNRDLALSIAKEAKRSGVKQFVFMSTVKVYGENSTLASPWTESTACYPQDAYGKSKLAAEQLLTALSDDDFCVSIIRTPVVYGKGVKGNIARMANVVKTHFFIPFGNIDNLRAMVYIGNLIAFIDRVMEKCEPGVFLINDEYTPSTSHFAQQLIVASGKKRCLLPIPAFVQLLVKTLKPALYQRVFGSMVLNNQETKKRLQFTPPFSLEEGLKDLMKGRS